MNNEASNRFEGQVTTDFQGETYLVRNNGAVYRIKRFDKRARKYDEVWTYGNVCKASGYMRIGSHIVHRIVATAYHGPQPSKSHVVDHIDTNRVNNRPENLRWVTKIDNILKNPKTLKRIEKKWGSLEELFNDPNPREKEEPIQNRWWMPDEILEIESTFESNTPNVLQRHWRTPSAFPNCPEETTFNPLYEYAQRLQADSVLSYNQFGESVVMMSDINPDWSCISVLCETPNSIKPWAVAKITFENNKFVHESKGSFFDYYGAEKQHCKIAGIDWVEPKDYKGCIDDFC